MRATGIIRRVDDLGRVVIPKEIRRQCGIVENDPLEIFLDKDGAVVFKKYDFDEQVMVVLSQLKKTIENAEDAPYRLDFMQTIHELEARLKLAKEEKKND